MRTNRPNPGSTLTHQQCSELTAFSGRLYRRTASCPKTRASVVKRKRRSGLSQHWLRYAIEETWARFLVCATCCCMRWAKNCPIRLPRPPRRLSPGFPTEHLRRRTSRDGGVIDRRPSAGMENAAAVGRAFPRRICTMAAPKLSTRPYSSMEEKRRARRNDTANCRRTSGCRCWRFSRRWRPPTRHRCTSSVLRSGVFSSLNTARRGIHVEMQGHGARLELA